MTIEEKIPILFLQVGANFAMLTGLKNCFGFSIVGLSLYYEGKGI